MARERLVVIGNGMAGCRAVQEVLKRDPERYEITIFGAEPRVNYDRIMLSPVLAGEKRFEDIVINDDAWYRDNGITLHLGRAIESIDAAAKVVAGRTLSLATAYNPTMTEQSVNNVPGAPDPLYAPNGNWDPSYAPKAAFRTTYAQFSNFVSYSADSSVRLTALGGDLALSANAAGLATAGQWEIPNRLQAAAPTAGFQTLYTLLPPTLLAASLGGDIVTGNGVALSPAATGQLELVAAGSILLNNGATGSLRMLDNDPVAMSNTLAPRVLAAATIRADRPSISASVRVFSRGCTTTSMATDFMPSGTPAPW